MLDKFLDHLASIQERDARHTKEGTPMTSLPPLDPPFRYCVKCHTPFDPGPFHWQRFCSPRCRTIFNNRRASGRDNCSDPIPTTPPPLDDLA